MHVKTDNLADKVCIPCSGATPPLSKTAREELLTQLNLAAGTETAWEIISAVNPQHWAIEKTFPFKNFVTALAFVNQVAEVAESEGHHPDLHLSWGKVRVEIWTHKISALTESDFILAAKIDALNG